MHLFVALGSQAGLRPGDLVGCIANEAGIPGRAVGAIDIRDKVSFIEVAAEHADLVVERLGNVKLRGLTLSFVPARAGSFERNRTRPTSGNPRKSFERPQGQSNGKPYSKPYSKPYAKRPTPGKHAHTTESRPWHKHGKPNTPARARTP